MDHTISTYLNQIEIGQLQHYENMSVAPLFPANSNGPEYMILKDAIAGQVLTISEINETGSVPQLIVTNNYQGFVFILDGEELLGAKQNRVVNTSILLKGNSESIIPVSCTEQGRWRYSSRNFSPSEKIMMSRGRANKARGVTNSLRMNRGYDSNQSQVWEDIRTVQMESSVNSPTGAMRDVYTAHSGNLQQYTQSFPVTTNQRGCLVFINGQPVGFDALSSVEAYNKLHNSLVESYALDAMLQNQNGFQQPSVDQARSFIQEATAASESVHPSVGVGSDYRYAGEQIVGSTLVFDKSVIHTAFFRLGNQRHNHRISRSGIRRDFRDNTY